MPSQFHWLLPIPKETLNNMWREDAFFVIDTNVYLNIYRYPGALSASLLDLLSLKGIQSRLFVPHQVAFEFHNRRMTVIQEQIKQREKLVAKVKSLREELTSLPKKYHFSSSKDLFSGRMQQFEEAFQKAIQDAESSYKASYSEDPYIDKIHKIFSGLIGPEFGEEELEQIKAEAGERAERKVPPGYIDFNESGSTGDFVIWKQLLSYGRENRRSCIFVTDDLKLDWWDSQQGHHTARKELRKEYGSLCQLQPILHLQFYSTESFIRRALDYFKVKADSAKNLELLAGIKSEEAQEWRKLQIQRRQEVARRRAEKLFRMKQIRQREMERELRQQLKLARERAEADETELYQIPGLDESRQALTNLLLQIQSAKEAVEDQWQRFTTDEATAEARKQLNELVEALTALQQGFIGKQGDE